MKKFCRHFTVVLILGFVLLSCKPATLRYNYSQPSETDNRVEERPKILFMSFLIQKKDGNTVVEQKDRVIKYGTLKAEPHNSEARERIYVAQVDKNMATISGFYIEHPLRRNVEYTNEQHELATKYLELAEAEFFIRTQLEQQSVYLRLDETLGDQVVNSFIFSVN